LHGEPYLLLGGRGECFEAGVVMGSFIGLVAGFFGGWTIGILVGLFVGLVSVFSQFRTDWVRRYHEGREFDAIQRLVVLKISQSVPDANSVNSRGLYKGDLGDRLRQFINGKAPVAIAPVVTPAALPESLPEIGDTSPDGFIRQGNDSLIDFQTQIAAIRAGTLTPAQPVAPGMQARLGALLDGFLSNRRVMGRISPQQARELRRLRDRIGSMGIYGINGIVRGAEDFVLGHHDWDRNEFFIATDLLQTLTPGSSCN
jgi:hypothetical protein